jgi:hypothetical protein
MSTVIDMAWKFWRLARQDRVLVLEAILWLAVAGIAIAVLPFRQIASLTARPVRAPKPPDHVRSTKVRRVRWAIITAARRVPWRAKCFQKGFAAQVMLRRRGIPSVLYYGAAQDEKNGLHTHVWLRDGKVDVVGGEFACRFATLATFPPAHDAESTSRQST